MAKIISFANQKGGVGKTTSTFNVGVELASQGFKTLLIDFDSQASLTIAAGLEPYDYNHSIVEVLESNRITTECIQPIRPNLDLVTSRIDLANLEMILVGRTMRETILKRILNKISDSYDYILIDCPPQLSILTINALASSDYVLVTTKTDYLSYRGIEHLCSTIDSLIELVNPDLEMLGVVATLHESRQVDDQAILKKLQNEFPVLGVVPKLVSVKSSIYEGKAVFEQYPTNDVAFAYRTVTSNLIQNTQTLQGV